MGDDRRSNVGGYPVGASPDPEEPGGEERLPPRMRELRTQSLRDREPPPTDRELDREAATRERAAETEPIEEKRPDHGR